MQSQQPIDDGDTPLERLLLAGGTPIRTRIWNCLERSEVKTIEQLVQMRDKDLLRIKNLGKKAIAELRELLAQLDPSQAHGPLFSRRTV